MDPVSQGNNFKVCKCPHHSIKPWAMILIGVVIILAATQVLDMETSLIIIGALIIVKGFMKLMGRKCKCC